MWASCPGRRTSPVLFGSTLGEFASVKLTAEEKEAMTQEDKLAFLHDRFGEDTDRLIELFRKAYPKHDILDLAYTDTVFRIPTMKAALNAVITLAIYKAISNLITPKKNQVVGKK